MNFFKRRIRSLLISWLKPIVQEIQLNDYSLYGSKERLKIAPSARVANTLFNTYSGRIEIQEYAFTGHNVSLLTGSHNCAEFGSGRMEVSPKSGNDILVQEGVWICSNVVVIGPAVIGRNSVVAAGSVVKGDIPPRVIAGGNPAKTIRPIQRQQNPHLLE